MGLGPAGPGYRLVALPQVRGGNRLHNLVRGRLRAERSMLIPSTAVTERSVTMAYVERGKVWAALGVITQAA